MDEYPLSGNLGHTGVVTRNIETAPTCWWMEIRCPELAAAAEPGQFVMLRCGRALDPLLSRAFSICDLVYEAGEPVGIVVLQVVIGVGTRALAERQAGEEIGLLGPLGKPHEVNCGAHYIRLGTNPLTRWHEKGRSINAPCKQKAEINLFGRPGVAPNPGGGTPPPVAPSPGPQPKNWTPDDL